MDRKNNRPLLSRDAAILANRDKHKSKGIQNTSRTLFNTLRILKSRDSSKFGLNYYNESFTGGCLGFGRNSYRLMAEFAMHAAMSERNCTDEKQEAELPPITAKRKLLVNRYLLGKEEMKIRRELETAKQLRNSFRQALKYSRFPEDVHSLDGERKAEIENAWMKAKDVRDSFRKCVKYPNVPRKEDHNLQLERKSVHLDKERGKRVKCNYTAQTRPTELYCNCYRQVGKASIIAEFAET